MMPVSYSWKEYKRWWEISIRTNIFSVRVRNYRFAFHKYPDFDKQMRMAVAMGAPAEVICQIIHKQLQQSRTK